MPLICYIDKNFAAKSLDVIAKVNAILDEYAKEGLDLTVRQIYYQFVSRDFIKNNLQEYKRLASIIDDARVAGRIDWDRIQDRTRFLRAIPFWASPAEIVAGAANSYKEDLWKDQPVRVEVWIEKDAGIGVIENVCNRWRVPYLSCRGYFSQSEMWSAGQRLKAYDEDGQRTHIIHLGDHDPSGIDMSRDIQDRLDLFTYPGCVTIHRIALNMDQVRKYNPPPNPAKLTDSRATKYIAEYGDESWELDALKPTILMKMIEDQIKKLYKPKPWGQSKETEELNRMTLQKVSDSYEDVEEFIRSK